MEETLTTGIIRSSNKTVTITSNNFVELRETINNTHKKRIELSNRLSNESFKLGLLLIYKLASYLFIFGFFNKKPTELHANQKEIVTNTQSELGDTFVRLEFSDKSQIEKSWLNCIDSFSELVKSNGFWDVTYSEQVDKVKARSFAGTGIKKEAINYNTRNIDFLRTDLPPLYLPNRNGSDIYIYPKFLVLLKSKSEYGILDLKEIDFHFDLVKYVEEEKVPSDAEIIDYTWKKVNKNGSKDLRYKENYQIPIAKYGILVIKTETGVDEAYMFSKASEMQKFEQVLSSHIHLLSK